MVRLDALVEDRDVAGAANTTLVLRVGVELQLIPFVERSRRSHRFVRRLLARDPRGCPG